jgi:hypothetical protein
VRPSARSDATAQPAAAALHTHDGHEAAADLLAY